MVEAWKEFEDDFNSMTDEQIAQETRRAQDIVDEQEVWLEAVASYQIADAMTARALRAQPEAPRVEQGPCATCGGRGHLMWEGGDSAKSVTEYEGCPTCSHPAPASNELLEALEEARSLITTVAANFGDGGDDSELVGFSRRSALSGRERRIAGIEIGRFRSLRARLQCAIAKHKGPQS